jgi:1-acyl-sn-glycerol-3-phosphate acyltransferase
MQVGVPLTPLLIEGAFDLWPSGAIFARPGSVTVTVLEPIKIGKDDNYVTLASKVRRAFYQQLLTSAQSQVSGTKKRLTS